MYAMPSSATVLRDAQPGAPLWDRITGCSQAKKAGKQAGKSGSAMGCILIAALWPLFVHMSLMQLLLHRCMSSYLNAWFFKDKGCITWLGFALPCSQHCQ